VINASAFRRCERLAQVGLPESLALIGDDAFASCSNLTDEISFPVG
jgi:hypothetical protein